MNRCIIIFLACGLSLTAFGQQTQTELYAQLESLHYNIIRVHIDGGSLCMGRSPAVVQAQNELTKVLTSANVTTGERVLLFAVMANSLTDVKRLIEAGALLTGDNSILLHTAGSMADPSMLEYLVSMGYSIEGEGSKNGSVLRSTVLQNRRDNIEWLIENGVDVNAEDQDGDSVLLHSLVCDNQELVNYLLSKGAVPNERINERAMRQGISLELN